MRPGFDDLVAFGGLLLIGGGLWFIYPPVAAVVVGALLLVLGLALARPSRDEGEPEEESE